MPTNILLLALALAKSEAGKAGPTRSYLNYIEELRAFVKTQGGGDDMVRAIATYHLACGTVYLDEEPAQALTHLDEAPQLTHTVTRLLKESLTALPTSHGHTLH